jgi:hypothetical protein
MKMNRKALGLCIALGLLACLPLSAQTTYNFSDVNYTGDTFTQLLSINDVDVVAGYHGASINQGFTYDFKTNTFTNENFPASVQTQVIGINDPPAKTVGFYIDKANKTHGFTHAGTTFLTVDYPGTPFNQLLGQNDFGQAAGYYSTKADGSGPDHAYVYDEAGKVFAVFEIPGSTSAQATSINGHSDVCGFYVDGKGNNHGWLLVQGQFTVLNYPGSTGTQALGLNTNNQVVGFYTDSTGGTHGFVYNTLTKKWQSIDDPNGIGTTIVNGINAKGVLVGFWGTAPLNTGFVAVPAAN